MNEFKSPFNSKDSAPLNAVSPSNNGIIHAGTDGIGVKLLFYPDEALMKNALAKMVKATIGGDPNENISDELGEELFKGGLQTGLESFTVIFEISGVSRAFTHQFVRTRKAVFHQQSSRYTFMGENFNARMPQTIFDNPEAREVYSRFITQSREAYAKLCDLNMPYQDARFACPVGLETYIIAQYPLKVFLDTYAYRACPMFQWEIVHVFKEMRRLLIGQFPWMEQYIKISCEKSKRCMFQGWESTDSVCDFEWNRERIYNPDEKIYNETHNLVDDDSGKATKDKYDGYNISVGLAGSLLLEGMITEIKDIYDSNDLMVLIKREDSQAIYSVAQAEVRLRRSIWRSNSLDQVGITEELWFLDSLRDKWIDSDNEIIEVKQKHIPMVI